MANMSSDRLCRMGWIAVLLTCIQVQEVFAKPLSFFARRKFQDGYRDVLWRYAEGETEGAIEAMILLESEMVKGDYSLQESVRRAEISIAKRLAASSVDALEATALFHEALYRRYREEGNPAAAGQARETMVALALELAQMKTAAEDAGQVAQFVSRQGKEMLASHAETMAMSLFEMAVEVDPGQICSRLCLAWIHEKRGRYEEALEELRGLVELEPEHREARLRWAMQVARQSRELEALALLEPLAFRHPSDWIRALAVQERARILTDSGELESALRSVVEARKDMPCVNGLAVQHAYLNERIGGFLGSIVLDETLRHCTDTPGASARTTYNRLPESCKPSAASEEDVLRSRLDLKDALAAIR